MQKQNRTSPRRVSQKDRVIAVLIHDILHGKRKPGQALRELTIAKELGTSQAPVREALRELQGLGYVTHKPRCGSSVALLTAEDLYQTYDIREALEAFCIGYHGYRFEKPENRKQLKKILADFTGVNTLSDFVATDFRFHEILVQQSQNILLLTSWQQVMNQAKIASFFLTTSTGLEKTVPIHLGIGEHLLDNNYPKALEELHRHYADLRAVTSTDGADL